MSCAAACHTRPDTEENVRKALDEANIHVDVNVDDEANVVHLSGTVETIADRTRAEEVARAAIGTSGQVLNELTVTSLEGTTPDDPDGQLREALDHAIDEDRVLRERDVNIAVRNGVVSITGEVRSADEKNRAERLVRKAAGAKDVTNALQISPE
jgi:osmotically-inducible protein OsmY